MSHFPILTATAGVIALACGFCVIAVQPSGSQERQVDGQVLRSFKPCYAVMGPASAIQDARLVRVTNREEWEQIWKEHRGDALDMTHEGGGGVAICPEIDWARCFVIARFRGDSWNCYGERVEAIEEFADRVRLRFDSATYQTAGPGGGGVRVTPFGIWVLPRVDGKAWVIEENVQNLKGQPPTWKERKRFDD